MPDLLTPHALATAGPLVIETLFKHFIGPKPSSSDKGKAREDLMYDEAFVLMKTFLEIATKYPCGALQRFGQVRTPSPPWVAVYSLLIPHQSLNEAAEHMIAALGGEEMAYKIAGGVKWWQVRAGRGLEAEWIVMKKDWRGVVAEEKRERKERELEKEKEKEREKEKEGVEQNGEARREDQEQEEGDGEFRPEMDRLRCMLYIHGGAYYWGSINTHRYTIWRYARKMHGRCFAVNYRKTPQYPFPCAIHDCLAAYMYLIKPPPGAKHCPVDPKSIIIAGDSAGGGLVLALLQILRDTDGLELPAGAVLISPWSDLTHSFPSILKNTATDIVPPYGFIHKPSSLWPPPPPTLTEHVQSRLRSRVKEAVSRIHHGPQPAAEVSPTVRGDTTTPENDKLKTSDPKGGLEKSGDQSESDLHPLADKAEEKHPEPQSEPTRNPSRANPADLFPRLVERGEGELRPTTLAQCTTPLKITVRGEQVLVDTQIQLYATNAQLCHPWVSPVLAYLGGLPPLFIMCGDQEVLRDEIVFLAHKAANPDAYPLREDVRSMLPSLEGIEEKHGPTNVHLQVYDGTCHDLPLLSMTRPARGAFRAIASFARYVTPSAPGSRYISKSRPNTPKASTANFGAQNHRHSLNDSSAEFDKITPSTPVTDNQRVVENTLTETPAVMSPKESIVLTPAPKERKRVNGPIFDLTLDSELSTRLEVDTVAQPNSRPGSARNSLSLASPAYHRTVSFASSVNSDSGLSTPKSRRESILPTSPVSPQTGSRDGSGPPPGDESGFRFDKGEEFLEDSNAKEGEAGWAGIYKDKDGSGNPFTDHMIRERVSISGVLRPLEPASELPAIQMPQDEIGFLKEGPVMRYLNGQALWDKKYRRAAKAVQRKREKNLKIARKEGGKIGREWMRRAAEEKNKHVHVHGRAHADANGQDVSHTPQKGSGKDDDESGTRTAKSESDSEEDLLDSSWSWTWALNGEAPPPSAVVSRRDIAEARQLALMADRLDSSHDTSMHGLSLWVGLAAFFSSSTERGKATEVVRAARAASKSKSKSEPGTLGDGDDPWASEQEEDGDESDPESDRPDGVPVRDHKDLVRKVVSREKRSAHAGAGVGKDVDAQGVGVGVGVGVRADGKHAAGGERTARRKRALPGWFAFWRKKGTK